MAQWTIDLVLFLVTQKGVPLKPPISKLPIEAFYCAWLVVRNTNSQDCNNDALKYRRDPILSDNQIHNEILAVNIFAVIKGW